MRLADTDNSVRGGQRGGCAIEPNGLRAVDYQPADQSSRHIYEHGTPDCARGQSILTKPVYGRSSEVPPRVPSSQDRAATIAEVVSLLPVAAATLARGVQ